MPDSILQLGFWMNVEDCLTEFHYFPGELAHATVEEYRAQLAQTAQAETRQWMEGLIYHAEPWNVACDLADNNLPLSEYQAQYQAVLSRSMAVTRTGLAAERYA